MIESPRKTLDSLNWLNRHRVQSLFHSIKTKIVSIILLADDYLCIEGSNISIQGSPARDVYRIIISKDINYGIKTSLHAYRICVELNTLIYDLIGLNYTYTYIHIYIFRYSSLKRD